jgi:hypothetical protein
VTVQVVEVLELHAADEQEDEEETIIDASELPEGVREAFDLAYPGAQIVEIEVEEDDEATEYDIVARTDGALLEVGLASDGEIVEVAQLLEESELPQEIVNWIDDHFDDAAVLEIEVVNEDGEVSYEFEIDRDGDPPMEVTLRLDQVVVEPKALSAALTPAPLVAAPPGDPAPQEPTAELPAAVATASRAAGAGHDKAGAADGAAETETDAAPEAGVESVDEVWLQTEEIPTVRESTPQPDSDLAESALLAPELLLRVVRIDLGGIEAQLQQLLTEIDRMVQAMARPESEGMWMRFALLLAMIAGAEIFLSNSLQRRPVSSVFMESDRSCAWSFWSATTLQK